MSDPDFYSVVGISSSSSPKGGGDDYGDYEEGTEGNVSCWVRSEYGFHGVSRPVDRIPPGFYKCAHNHSVGCYLAPHKLSLDKLMRLPDSPSEQIVEEIRRFRGRKEQFRSLGFLHKRGVLLWGPAGSGKTSTVMLLCDLIVKEEGGIAAYADDPVLAQKCLKMLREIEPERPVLLILEELDVLVEDYGVSNFLALLDGEAQIDNIVTVATTNFPERLDKTLTNRPGRFPSIRYIGMPSRLAREAYILEKCPQLANGNLESYLDASEGLSIDHLREIIILTQCDDVPLAEAARRMKRMRSDRPSSEAGEESEALGMGAT